MASNSDGEEIDPRSAKWLGRHSPVDEIRESGLWNIDHVDEEYDPDFLDFLERNIDDTGVDQTTLRSKKLDSNSTASQKRNVNQESDSFTNTWAAIIRFAESKSFVSTLSRGNDNEIRPGDGAIEVRNLDTNEWRELDKADFRFAYDVLWEKDRLTLDDIEPELAGRKSTVMAILAKALKLDYDGRPLTVYR